MKRKDEKGSPQEHPGCTSEGSLANVCKVVCDFLAWVAKHHGSTPVRRSDDPEERRLAQAYKRLSTRRDKPYAAGSTKPSDQKLSSQEIKLFDVIAIAMQLEAELPGILHCLLQGLDLMQQVDAFEPLLFRLRALRVTGHVTPGGLTSLDPLSMTPWAQALPTQGNRKDWETVAQQLGSYTWWGDLFVCGCARPRFDSVGARVPRFVAPHPEASPQCRLVWSGLLGAPIYVRPDLFRFGVDAQLNDAIPEFTEECPPHCACECRVICISAHTLQVHMHADTRRAHCDEFARCFGNTSGTEIVGVVITVEPQDIAQGYIFRHLDIMHALSEGR